MFHLRHPKKSHMESDSEASDGGSSVFDSVPNSPNSLESTKPNDTKTLQKSRPASSYETPPLPYESDVNNSPTVRRIRSTQRPSNSRHSMTDLKSLKTLKEGSEFNPKYTQRNFSSPSADLRIPPSTLAARKESATRREKSFAPTAPSNVLKLKIFFHDDVVALRLRKDKLLSVKDIVDVIVFKQLSRKKCNVDDIKIVMTFPDNSLQPVTLKDPKNRAVSFAMLYGDLMMDYLQNKSKIYVKATCAK